MANNHYILLVDFCAKHDISRTNVHVQNSLGRFDDRAIKSAGHGTYSYINEQYFVRRKQFKFYVWDTNHTMYYFLRTTMKNSDLARLLAEQTSMTATSWATWMSTTMWYTNDSSILDYKVSDNSWAFFREVRAIIRQMFRKLNIPMKNRDLETLLMKDV